MSKLTHRQQAELKQIEDAAAADKIHQSFGIPKGLTPIVTFSSLRRNNIRRKLTDKLRQAVPADLGDYKIELEDVWVDSQEASPTAERNAIIQKKSLHEKVYGTLILRDKDGNVIERKDKHLLARLPYLTDDGTFILDGTAYTPRNQLRTRSGVFTRKRSNDEIEASFNLAKGVNFRLSMEPESGRINIEFGTSKIPLYPILRALRYSHEEIASKWGAEVAKINAKYDDKRQQYFDKLYAALIPSFKRKPTVTFEQKLEMVREYLDKTRMDAEVNRLTLGKKFDKVTPEALVSASKKLLDVYNGKAPVDDRDALQFQRIHGIEDFLSERVGLDAPAMHKKMKTTIRFDRGRPITLNRLLPANSFGRGIKSFVTSSSILTTSDNVNPLENLDALATITRLGEGGISSERAIPNQARMLHGSHFGFIGPLRTPESSRAGIDVRATANLARDDEGRMYTPLWDLKEKKIVYKAADELIDTPIAFPEQETSRGNVDVLHNGEAKKLKPGQVRYQMPHPSSMYSIGTNLLPGLQNTQGNRGLMGSKAVTQALPLTNPEAPLVQIESINPSVYDTSERMVANLIEAVSPVDGVIDNIDKDYIYVKGNDQKTHKVRYKTNYPGAKTRLHQTPAVKVGQRVEEGEILTDSNFTRNKRLAIGTNLNTAWLAHKGVNSDDAVVISRTAANKLTSEHFYTFRFRLDDNVTMGVDKHAVHCPGTYTREQYSKVGANGIAPVKTKVKTGDPLIVAVRKTAPSSEDMQLGRLHKSLVKSYVDASTKWEKPTEGEVVDSVISGNNVTVTVITREPAKIGDKITGLHGNKGVIGKILEDEDMYKDEKGNPIDLLVTSAGVISRINPGQNIVAALGKAAKAQGKEFHTFRTFDTDNRNAVSLAKEELRKAGLNPSGKETVTDPITGRKIPNIFVGPMYTLKLFKTTESNYAARNTGGYDSIQQPTKGGSTAAKAAGGLSVNGLLAHNARGYLSDITNIKSQQNGDYWRAVQLGLPAPTPASNFAYSKFLGMLQGSGIKVHEKDDSVALAPMTDKDVLEMSSGEIKNPRRLRSKDLQPEKGGLFDPAVTGGVNGQKWSHIDLKEPIPNPIFFDPARRLLGKTQDEMMKEFEMKGGHHIRNELNKIDIPKEMERLKKEIRETRGTRRDDALKRLKYLQALDKVGLKAGDAYTLSAVPVVPPAFRPISPSGRGDNTLITDDANYLYRDTILSKEKLQELKSLGLPDEFLAPERRQLFQSVAAVAGMGEPTSPQAGARGVKGFLKNIAGTSPKYGFFQSKLIKRKQDLSTSSTIALNPFLGVDEVEIPEESGWTMYEPFIIRRLVDQGMKRSQALEEVQNRTEIARSALLQETKHRPIVMSRSPVLHRFGIMGMKPKLIPGKTINMNPYISEGFNNDFDGDAMIGSLPVTEQGRKDALNMLPSNHLFTDKERGDLLIAPKQEAVVGLHKATLGKSNKPVKEFESMRDAMAAYRRGDIAPQDPVIIKNK